MVFIIRYNFTHNDIFRTKPFKRTAILHCIGMKKFAQLSKFIDKFYDMITIKYVIILLQFHSEKFKV